jgi:two-component system, OmpR family, osmolarity sensor histidine kinase EnvZ
MRSWTGSIFVRTLVVLILALGASQAASLWLLREYVTQPRLAGGISQFVSHLKTISAALESLPPGGEITFIGKLAEKEGIRVIPARGVGAGRPAPDVPSVRLFRERLKAIFGAEAEVYIRPGAPNVLWIRMPAGEREYWIAFPRTRIERDTQGALIGWAIAGVVIAILATILIAWRMSRPLAELARAAQSFGQGGNPAPVPEHGPTEVRAVAQAFNRMKDDLQHNQRERATFLAGVSHDLRTPIARLRLEVEMLAGKVAPENQRAMVGDLEDMNAIIDQFIDFGRGEAAEAMSAVDLVALAREGAERAARSGALVNVEAGDIPRLLLRPLAIQRLLDNLIGNAIKHAGGEIVVRLDRTPREVRLAVLDRGPGIPQGEFDRLKQPFTRLDESRAGRSGSGLGLAIVARIAAAHGARFDLEPRAGGGLAATVSFRVNET